MGAVCPYGILARYGETHVSAVPGRYLLITRCRGESPLLRATTRCCGELGDPLLRATTRCCGELSEPLFRGNPRCCGEVSALHASRPRVCLLAMLHRKINQQHETFKNS